MGDSVAVVSVSIDFVHDDESLFRRVEVGDCPIVNGVRHIKRTAFKDPRKQPSVDRAHFKGGDPRRSQISPTDGIAQLQAGEVRRESVIRGAVAGQTHAMDVLPRPEPTNDAHAIISTNPQISTSSPFKRFQESLARLAMRRPLLIDPT